MPFLIYLSPPTSQKTRQKREHTVSVRRLKGAQHLLEDLPNHPPVQVLVAIASVTGVLPQEPGTLRTPHSSRLPRSWASRPFGFSIPPREGGAEHSSAPMRGTAGDCWSFVGIAASGHFRDQGSSEGGQRERERDRRRGGGGARGWARAPGPLQREAAQVGRLCRERRHLRARREVADRRLRAAPAAYPAGGEGGSRGPAPEHLVRGSRGAAGEPGRGAQGPAGAPRARPGQRAAEWPGRRTLLSRRAGPGRPRHGAGECPGEETEDGARGRRAGDAKPLPSTAILPASHSASAADPAPAALPRPPPRPRGLRSSAAAAINLQRSLTAGGAAPRIPGKRSPGKRAPGQAPAFSAASGAPGASARPRRAGKAARGWPLGCERRQGWGSSWGEYGRGTARAPCPKELHFTALGCFSPGFQVWRLQDKPVLSQSNPPPPPHSLAGRRSLSAGKEKGAHSTGNYQSAPHPRMRPSVFVYIIPFWQVLQQIQKKKEIRDTVAEPSLQVPRNLWPNSLAPSRSVLENSSELVHFSVLRYQKGFEDFFPLQK